MVQFIQPYAIHDTVLAYDRRVLLYGPPGIGKSTMAAQLARSLFASGRLSRCISADPGSPAFGVPGAITLAKWLNDNWEVITYEALCTLDAGRFRLPLIVAVQRLAQTLGAGMVFVDAPGVVRGVAGRELLAGLIEAARIDAVLAFTVADRPPPLLDELRAMGIEVFAVPAAPDAKRPGKKTRAKQRTTQWDAFLADATQRIIDLARVNLLGTPPPREEPSVWTGRQIALLSGAATIAMGETQRLEGNTLLARFPAGVGSLDKFDTIVMRDAVRTPEGVVETAAPFAAERLEHIPPAYLAPAMEESNGPRIVGRVGPIDIALVNGVFGDPLLHLRSRYQRRSLLFDLGQGGRLPARLAHQISDVFISHAHFDHIGGFLWLLRSRIGEFPPCRLYGPPGLTTHIAGFIQGILWDRVAEHGPLFEITEIHGQHLQRFSMQAGRKEPFPLGQTGWVNGVLLDEPGFKVRATVLDHNRIPVIAYAYEAAKQINIRKDRLHARNLNVGHWLTQLKQCLMADDNNAMIQLPDGAAEQAGVLGNELTLITPGKKLVYATDLADTPDNRERLTAFARNAHTFFCEASFLESDVDRQDAPDI
ncbi:MAG: MBL fold metallo-hydrolase [Gammaproteobacteria bacterium]|nr:MBL fold metallo-hydrolase [Gammaproteobacteria bacterium]